MSTTDKINRSIMKCDSCGSTRIAINKGFSVCTDCGITIDKQYEDHTGYVTTNKNETLSHTQPAKSLQYNVIKSTMMNDFSKLNHKNRNKYRRISRLNYIGFDRDKDGANITDIRTIRNFNVVFDKLNLSNTIKKRALYLYWQHHDNPIVTNHMLLICVCLIKAVKESDKAPVTIREVVKEFKRGNHRVSFGTVTRLVADLDINLTSKLNHIPRAEDYIERVANEISRDPVVRKRLKERVDMTFDRYEILLIRIANRFLSLLSKKDRGGLNPLRLATTVVYVASRVLSRTMYDLEMYRDTFAKRNITVLTQEIAGNACDCPPTTIRDHMYKYIGKHYKKHKDTLKKYIATIW